MDDNELREAAARALGWRMEIHGTQPVWFEPGNTDTFKWEPPPLDWTTAGALLEMSYGRVAIGLGGVMWGKAGAVKHNPTINARSVIEACVMALENRDD